MLHFLNQTLIDAFSKQQNQVKSTTYGSEFMATCQAMEQIIDLCYTLCMLGVPLEGPSWLFGNIKSVMMSSMIPHSSLNKHWNALSYHKVCEAITSGFMHFKHIPTGENPTDILTKPLPWHKACVHVEPLLSWKGKTITEPIDPLLSNGPIRGE